MAQNSFSPEFNYYPTDMQTGGVSAPESSAEKPQANTPSVQVNPSNVVPGANGSQVPNGVIKSSNYVPNIAGWLLDSDGNIYGVAILTQGGRIANWYINANTIASGSTEAGSNILLDSLNSVIRLGATSGNYITLDGANQRIQSSNYSAGLNGFLVSPNLIEAQNLQARGIMQGATFQYNVVSCVGGQMMVANADVLDADLAANATLITTKGTTTFAVNDLFLIRALASTGVEEEWFRIIEVISSTSYRVTRDFSVNFAAAKTNLKGFWRFDENTGTSARDSSTTANHGTIVNATYVNGQYGKALSFNGTSAYVSIPDNAAIKPTTALSIAFWVYNPGAAFSQIIHRQDFGANKGYSVSIDATNQISFNLGDGTSFTTTYGGVNSVPINTWTHFVCTWSGSGVATIYKNGALLSVSSTFTGPISYAAGDLHIGKNSLYAGEYFTGYIDEVRIYNTGLTAGQALTMYSGEYPLFYKGCTIAKQGKSDSISTYSGGWLRLIGEGTNSPYYSVFSRTGAAFDSYLEACRFGNLNGIGSFSSDTYGIFIGNYGTGKYFSYDTLSGNMVINGYVQTSIGAFGGDGSDGALSISSGTTTIDLAGAAVVTKNYTSISITGTGVLTFSNPHANGTAIILKSQGAVTVTSSATFAIDASGMGAAGAASVTKRNGGLDGNTGNSGISLFITNVGGTAGKVNSASDGAGAVSTTVFSRTLSSIISKYPAYFIGGGGGSGCAQDTDNVVSAVSGAGGNGGPFLAIECRGAWNVTGNISVAGKVGGNGSYPAGTRGYATGGGGGGGGNFLGLYNTLTTNSGAVSTSGGSPGTGVLVVGAGTTTNSGGVGGSSGSNNSATAVRGGINALGVATAGADGYSLIQQNKDFA